MACAGGAPAQTDPPLLDTAPETPTQTEEPDGTDGILNLDKGDCEPVSTVLHGAMQQWRREKPKSYEARKKLIGRSGIKKNLEWSGAFYEVAWNIPFHPSFSFDFYGEFYDSAWVSSEGGLTFGQLHEGKHPTAPMVVTPGIGVFWSDLIAPGAPSLTVEACENAFFVHFDQLRHQHDDTSVHTATVRLASNGTIQVQYGTVDGTELLVGIWDGTHDDDQFVDVKPIYGNYATTGTGLLLYDEGRTRVPHEGDLSDQTLVFVP